MPTRPTRARPPKLPTAAAALAVLTLTAPAFAQTGTDSETPATGDAQSSQTMQSTTPNADTDAAVTPDRHGNTASQPGQKLPEPKSSDYGASSYHAPSDAELAQFTATHPTPAASGTDTSDDNNGDDTSGTTGNSPMANAATDDSASSSDDAMGTVSGDDGMSSANGSAPNNRNND